MSALLLKEDTFDRIKWWQILLIVWGILQGIITLCTLRIGHRQFLSVFPERKRKRFHWLWVVSWPVGFVLTLFWPGLLVWMLWGSLDGVRKPSDAGGGVPVGEGGDLEEARAGKRDGGGVEGNDGGVNIKDGGEKVGEVEGKGEGGATQGSTGENA